MVTQESSGDLVLCPMRFAAGLVQQIRSYRTEQLRILCKLQCYYLDKFNQNGVFIRHKQKCKAALQSGPRSKGVAPSRSVLVPGNCSTIT
jgi:hypothetical protein